jgi:hypothetical protein
VVDACCEVHLRRLKRVVGGEVDGKEEDTALEWRVAGSHYRCLPVKLCNKYVSPSTHHTRQVGHKSFENG